MTKPTLAQDVKITAIGLTVIAGILTGMSLVAPDHVADDTADVPRWLTEWTTERGGHVVPMNDVFGDDGEIRHSCHAGITDTGETMLTCPDGFTRYGPPSAVTTDI